MKKLKYTADADAFHRLQHRSYEEPLLWFVLAFQIICMLMLAFRDGKPDLFCIVSAAALPFVTYRTYLFLKYRYFADLCLFLCTAFLCALGLITLRSVKPENSFNHALYLLIGTGVLLFGCVVIQKLSGSVRAVYILGMIAVIALNLLPLMFGVGGNTHNWVRVGGRQFQPSELMKPAMVLILAYGYAKGPRMRYWLWYTLFGAACCAVIAFAQKDLGGAFLYFMLTIAMFAAGTGRVKIALTVFILFAAACVCVVLLRDSLSFIPNRVIERIEIWDDPLQADPEKARQIIQGLISICSGGLLGSGLGLSYAGSVYVVASDYIFAAVAETFGMIFAVCVIGIYLLMLLRGMSIALNARTRFHSLVAFGCTFLIVIQMLTIVMGNLKLIPLTGVTLPFVSDGGSSLVSCLMLMGMLLGISGMNAEDEEDDHKKINGGHGK